MAVILDGLHSTWTGQKQPSAQSRRTRRKRRRRPTRRFRRFWRADGSGVDAVGCCRWICRCAVRAATLRGSSGATRQRPKWTCRVAILTPGRYKRRGRRGCRFTGVRRLPPAGERPGIRHRRSRECLAWSGNRPCAGLRSRRPAFPAPGPHQIPPVGTSCETAILHSVKPWESPS